MCCQPACPNQPESRELCIPLAEMADVPDGTDHCADDSAVTLDRPMADMPMRADCGDDCEVATDETTEALKDAAGL